MHAELPDSEKNRLLYKNTDKPRIVISTNVAEESITLPYIHIVIDLGTQKVLRRNIHAIPILGIENTARSNGIQRA